MGRREKTGCELVHPPGNSQKKNHASPRKLPCREGERGARFYSLVSNRQEKKIILQISSPLSTGLFFPSASTEDAVPVSCRSARGSLIKRMSRCHRSLGRVCSAPASLSLPALAPPA